MTRGLLVAFAVVVPACARIAGLDDVTAVGDAGTDTGGDDGGGDGGTQCNGTTTSPLNEGAAHTPDFMPVTWNANPPTSGTHYPDWARWDATYTTEIPRGFWVHNLEHGGIVLLYNCTDCQAEIDRLTAIMTSMPVDAACTAPIQHRMIVTRDSMLPAGVQFAATAWDFSYTAVCLNEPELRTFVIQHYGGGPESGNCSPGSYP